MLVMAEGEGRNDTWPMQPVLGSAGKGGENRAGGCPVLQDSVCMGEVSQSLAAFCKVLGFFGSVKHSNNYVLI